ncbi:hypothetical protein EWM64_g7992, partial [Hericium alpestre]
METKAEIVRWVSESLHPFNVVGDPRFVSLMKTGHSGYYLPSPCTVSHDVKLEYDGDLNFVTDAWSSPNHRAFIALTVHLLLNGKPISILLDFLEVAESHSSLNLAKVFAQILEDFDISDKILSVTCDNASANNAMICELKTLLPDFPGETNHTRCFVHIVNLVAKSLLKQFDAKSKCGAPDSEAELMPELEEIEDELEEEEAQARIEDAIESGEVDPKNGEGLVDEVAEISADEQKELAKNMRL